MKNDFRSLIAAIVTIFLCACSPFSYERQKINYFLIWYEQEAKIDPCHISMQVQVNSVTGADIVETTQMIVKEKENNVSYIPYCRWKTTVPRMFEELLNRDIKIYQINKLGQVYYQETVLIKAHIYSFWVEAKKTPVLKVGIWFETKYKSKGGEIRPFQRSYEKESILKSITPEEYAKAASEVFKDVTGEFLKDLCVHLKG